MVLVRLQIWPLLLLIDNVWKFGFLIEYKIMHIMLLFEKVLIISATLILEETILQIIMIVGDGKICSLDSHHHVGRPPSSHLHVSSDIFKITGCKKYHCFERHLGTCENIPISKVVAALALPDKVH